MMFQAADDPDMLPQSDHYGHDNKTSFMYGSGVQIVFPVK